MLPRERTAAMCFSLSAAEISADPFAQEGTSIYCCRADDQSRTQARRGREEGGKGRGWTERRRRDGEVHQDKKKNTEVCLTWSGGCTRKLRWY